MKLKSKILLGLSSLLVIIVLLSFTGINSIYHLSKDSAAIITYNYTSVDLSVNMLKAIDDMYSNQLLLMNAGGSGRKTQPLVDSLNKAMIKFEQNLEKQRNHVAEPGEAESMENIRRLYLNCVALMDKINAAGTSATVSDIEELRRRYDITTDAIRQLYTINMRAILYKNKIAESTANNVTLYMSIAAVLSLIITLLFIIHFPAYIVSPIRELTGRIQKIANKKYDQRIEVSSNDEISLLADAFNEMAVRLKEYETQHIDELLLEKRRMETLLVNLQDGTLLLDNNFAINHANSRFCELANRSVTQLLGKKLTDLEGVNELMLHIRTIDLSNLRSSASEKIKPVKVTMNDKTEYYQILLLKIHKGIRETAANASGYIVIVRNVTIYEERDLAKTNLIATISHELKTPLSSINHSIKLLEDDRVGSLNTEQKQLTQSLKIHSGRILNLVNEVLEFAQAETGHLKSEIGHFQVRDIIEAGTLATNMLLAAKEIDLELNIPSTLPPVKCDLKKSVWVLVNLLSNAAQYSPSRSRISISVDNQNDNVTIAVTDEGPGVRIEEQKLIFNRFVKSASQSSKGTGLGLAIAKEYVEAQGGTIGVKSEYGKGSCFYFTLPSV